MPIDPTDLKAILDVYNANTLVSIATYFHVLPPKQRTKALLIDLIIKEITQPEKIRHYVVRLSTAERAVLDAITRREGRANVRNIRAELTGLRLVDPNARVEFGEYNYNYRPNPTAVNSRRLEDILAKLMISGLIFAVEMLEDDTTFQPKRTIFDAASAFFIPPQILKHLPEPIKLPESEVHIRDVNQVEEGSARVFQRDLYLYWSFIRDTKPGLTQKDELQKAALKEINNKLLVKEAIKTGESETDHPRLRFLRGMLSGLKLIEGDPFRGLTSTGDPEFFSLSPDERVKRTYETWLETDCYSELLLLPGEVRPRSTSNPLIPAKKPVLKARKFIMDQLRRLVGKNAGSKNADSKDDASWFSIEALVDQVYSQDYEFFLRRPPVTSYYTQALHPYDYSSNELFLTFPTITREEVGWQKVEANLIRSAIWGPMYWMGLVDLGYKKEEAPAAFRLTALGAWLFKLGPKPEIPTEGGRVIVQPNMHVLALDPILDSVLATLDRFAERLSAERAVEYRLTRASVYAGQQVGWDAPKIKEALENLTGAELPGNVSRTLDEWQAQYERITIHPQVVLMHGAPSVMDGTMQNNAVRGWIKARPLPELAILRNPKSVNQLVHHLHEKEILPVINTRAEVPQHAVTCLENGEIQFNARTPSLYLHGHLVAFADPVGEAYQITSGSVQRAVRSGLTAPDILHRLESIHTGPLPEKVIRNIRIWARHYGSAGLASTTLLQVRDVETLGELLEDPEIGPLIKRFTPKRPQALAQVQSKDLEKLRALLAERGIDLTDRIE